MAVLVTAPAMAQAPQWTDRGFIFGNFVFQIQSNKTVTSTATPTVYDEKATIEAAQIIKGQGATFDVGGGVRIVGNLGVGVAYSQLSTKGEAALSASVPHPLVYDRPRTATGTATGFTHKEQQIHVFAMWMIPATEKFDVGVYGGPTFFQLKQDLVGLGTPPFTEVGSPYTSVTMNATQSQVSASKVGFNVGADLTFKLNKTFGVGGFARYSTAKIPVTPTGGSEVQITVGGMQVGAGLRIRF
jgi:hypothetical protein